MVGGQVKTASLGLLRIPTRIANSTVCGRSSTPVPFVQHLIEDNSPSRRSEYVNSILDTPVPHGVWAKFTDSQPAGADESGYLGVS